MDMISFGSVFLELVFGHVPALPGPGEEVYTDEFAVSCGGAVTSASAAARAGAQAGLCTVLGDDLGSGVVAEFCAGLGVDLTFSRRVQRPSAGITVVLNFHGDRAFVTHNPPARPASQQRSGAGWACCAAAGPGGVTCAAAPACPRCCARRGLRAPRRSWMSPSATSSTCATGSSSASGWLTCSSPTRMRSSG